MMYGEEDLSSSAASDPEGNLRTSMVSCSDSLSHLVPTYRRDSSEVIGAVRRSSVEFLGMEQMPGGKFQITARTISGADAFVSPVKTSLADGQACLEEARRSFGGEEIADNRHDEFFNALDAMPQNWGPGQDDPPTSDIAARPEPRIPTFAFADIEAPELPTSVR